MSKSPRGFTLVELLVVLGIISTLLAILLPVLSNVRQQARAIINTSNLRQTAVAVNLYAMDNEDHYPESVATIGTKDNWNWSNPTKLAGEHKRTVASHRAMSEYLRPYIPTANVIYCQNGPKKYKYLQAAWDAGDDWGNPDTATQLDHLIGNYCFYWNYIGYLPNRDTPFVGPKTAAGSWRASKLLMTDYLGYDHWRNPSRYSSCERFKNADIVLATWRDSAYWSCEDDVELTALNIKIRASYTDGSVRIYSTAELTPMKVSLNAEGTDPYPEGLGPGTFYLPSDALPTF